MGETFADINNIVVSLKLLKEGKTCQASCETKGSFL